MNTWELNEVCRGQLGELSCQVLEDSPLSLQTWKHHHCLVRAGQVRCTGKMDNYLENRIKWRREILFLQTHTHTSLCPFSPSKCPKCNWDMASTEDQPAIVLILEHRGKPADFQAQFQHITRPEVTLWILAPLNSFFAILQLPITHFRNDRELKIQPIKYWLIMWIHLYTTKISMPLRDSKGYVILSIQ